MALLSRRQKTTDLTQDHGHGVGGKLHVQISVKVIYGLDETDAALLQEIVHVLAAVVKALDHAENQPKVALDQLPPGVVVALVGPGEQLPHALVGQRRQRRRVDPADFHLVASHKQTSTPASMADMEGGYTEPAAGGGRFGRRAYL